MCGIVGFTSSRLETDSKIQVIKAMLRMIVHRGPDEQGYVVSSHCALGAVRLSILDISQGTQPMSDQSGRFWITYNGEVYNYLELQKELQAAGYTFRTNCDTEVVLNAFIHWGTDAFKKFNGGFAFCIYDKVKSKLYLARDRIGKRPLYFTSRKNQLLFASEMKAFLSFPDFDFSYDSESLETIFSNWTPEIDQSCFSGIKQIKPGHFLEYDISERQIKEECYYELLLNPQEEKITLEEASEGVRRLIRDSVKLRLRSDVEVAVYLSGGLDSSITTSIASELIGERLKAFSIQFDNGGFDESDAQAALVDHLGIEHSYIRIRDVDIIDSFEEALYFTETPQFRSAFVPMFLLSELVSKSDIKVVLTGEGADEFFLGYDVFKEADMLYHWPSLNSKRKLDRLQNLYPFMEGFKANAGKLAARYGDIHLKEGLYSLPHAMRYQTAAFSKKLLAMSNDSSDDSPLGPIGYNAVQKTQHVEIQSLLHGYLLSSQGDRMALAHGVENRLPFLDPNVIDFANRLPQSLKLSKKWEEKQVLRKAFEEDLPKEISSRHKIPYLAPDSAAFLSHPSNLQDQLLSATNLKSRDWLDSRFSERFIRRMKTLPETKISPRENHAFMLLISTMLLEDLFVRGGWQQYAYKHGMNFKKEVVLTA